MNIVNVSEEYKLAGYYLSNLRDSNLQKDRLSFCENVKRLSQILTWEFSKTLAFKKESINTPFSTYDRLVPDSSIIMLSIVRAGIPIQQVAMSMINCENAVFCTCEKNADGLRSAIFSGQLNVTNKILVVAESIMTSASSMLCCLSEVVKIGRPSMIVILNLLSTPLSIDNIKEFEDKVAIGITLYTCGIDDFTPGIRGTIPGLGDVGDLYYGLKK